MIDIKKLIGEYFGFNQEIAQLNAKYDLLLKDANEKLVALNEQIKLILASDETNKSKIAELQKVLDAQAKERALELEITNKRPKTKVSYLRYETDGQYDIDVRNFYQYIDDNLPVATGDTNDLKALGALNLTRQIMTYVSDDSAYGKNEYWAYAYQSLKRKRGDCEDGAILMANIMLKSGIPYWRVRLNAGSVKGGGHAYVTYCRETDNEWVVCDWCYWPNSKPMSQRPTHKEERNYMDAERNFYVWFSWDAKNIYASEKLPAVAKEQFVEKK